MLKGLRVTITGELKKYTRRKAFDIVSSHGGKPTKSLSSLTDLLVISQSSIDCDLWSYKREKAINLLENGSKLRIITEDEFYNMLEVKVC